jgi:hypothetical protein
VKTNNAHLFAYSAAIVGLATVIVVVSLLAGLNWAWCLMLICATGVLAWGMLFTLFEVHRLSSTVASIIEKEQRDDLIVRQIAALEPTAKLGPAELREIWLNSEPYPHHEDHPGSPGEDQGQLTSHLSGSTPLIELLQFAFWTRRGKNRNIPS